MTAKGNPLADAPSTYLLAFSWDSINWKEVVAHVRQLQLRIAKASQNKNEKSGRQQRPYKGLSVLPGNWHDAFLWEPHMATYAAYQALH